MSKTSWMSNEVTLSEKINNLELEQVRHIELLTEEFGKVIKDLEKKLELKINALNNEARIRQDYVERTVDLEKKLADMENIGPQGLLLILRRLKRSWQRRINSFSMTFSLRLTQP